MDGPLLNISWEKNERAILNNKIITYKKRQFPCIEIYSYLQIGAYSKIHIFMGFECIKNICYHNIVILLYPCNFLFAKKLSFTYVYLFLLQNKLLCYSNYVDWKCIALKNLFTYHKVVTLGTIQVLRHHVFDFFRPTHPSLWWLTVL